MAVFLLAWVYISNPEDCIYYLSIQCRPWWNTILINIKIRPSRSLFVITRRLVMPIGDYRDGFFYPISILIMDSYNPSASLLYVCVWSVMAKSFNACRSNYSTKIPKAEPIRQNARTLASTHTHTMLQAWAGPLIQDTTSQRRRGDVYVNTTLFLCHVPSGYWRFRWQT